MRRMRTGKKWRSRGMRVVPPCGQGRLCGLRRPPLPPTWGGWRPSPRAVGGGAWLQGPGRDQAAQKAELVSSVVCRRRGLRSPLTGCDWAGLLQFTRVRASASAGGKSSHGLHAGARQDSPRLTDLRLVGVFGSLGGVGVSWGPGPFVAGVCGLLGVKGGESCILGPSLGWLEHPLGTQSHYPAYHQGSPPPLPRTVSAREQGPRRRIPASPRPPPPRTAPPTTTGPVPPADPATAPGPPGGTPLRSRCTGARRFFPSCPYPAETHDAPSAPPSPPGWPSSPREGGRSRERHRSPSPPERGSRPLSLAARNATTPPPPRPHSHHSRCPRRHHNSPGPRSRRASAPGRDHAGHRRPMSASPSPHQQQPWPRASRSPRH